MSEKKDYIIPRRITTRFELFPGWGWTELLILLVGMISATIFYFSAQAIGIPPSIRVPLSGALAVISFLISRPSPVSGDNGLIYAKSFINYLKNPKIYVYDYDAFKEEINEKPARQKE